MAWVYLTGWVTADNVVHFRDDIYNHDGAPSRALVADLGALKDLRASGFILQSADPQPVRAVSYLDSQ